MKAYSFEPLNASLLANDAMRLTYAEMPRLRNEESLDCCKQSRLSVVLVCKARMYLEFNS